MSNSDGLTVYEAARREIQRLVEEISERQARVKKLRDRMFEYQDSKMLEAERIATESEPFQDSPLVE